MLKMRGSYTTYIFGLFLVVFINTARHQCEEVCEFEQEYSTISRWFHADLPSAGKGACMLNVGTNRMVGAVAYNLFGDSGEQWSRTCGACVHVEGPNGEVTVKLVDGCGEGIQLSYEAFNIIGDPNWGSTSVTWYFVECPDTKDKDIRYKFKHGSSIYWFGIQPNDHSYPVKKMELRKIEQFGETWINLARDTNNFYRKPDGMTIAAPFELRMTSWTEELLYEPKEIDRIPDTDNELIDGTVQFTKSSCTGSEIPPSSTFSYTTTLPSSTLSSTLSYTTTLPSSALSSTLSYTTTTSRTSTPFVTSTQTEPLPELCYVEGEVEYEATATYYSAAELAAQGFGTCEIDTNGDLMVAAMAESTYLNAQVCGQCIQVTNSIEGKNVVVAIIDKCSRSTCFDHDLDLSLQAYRQIADPLLDASVEVTWRIVECEVEGKINYRFRENSSNEWFELQPLNHLIPIKEISMEIERGSGWTEMERDESNYFRKPVEYSSVATPFRIQITGLNEENLVDEISVYPGNENLVALGSVQFSSCKNNASKSHLMFSSFLLLISSVLSVLLLK